MYQIQAKLLLPDVEPPRLIYDKLILINSYAQSETGHSLTTLIPPFTTRLVRTGIRLTAKNTENMQFQFRTPSGNIKDRLLVLAGDQTSQDELHINLYNGGHVSINLKHGSPIAEAYLAPDFEHLSMVVTK